MAARSICILTNLLLGTTFALPELSIQKKSYAEFGDALPAKLIKKRDVAGSGYVTTNAYSLLRWSGGGAYYANVTVGTPAQEQVVILDTGSSDLYFDASSASACQDTTSPYSCRGGTFNPTNSKTYKIVDQSPAFNTSFGDGSTALGPFAIDTVGVGDAYIQNVQFGVAEEVSSTTGYAVGLMGVGYSENEATTVQYPNIPEVLKDAGVINSRLYSIYLNDVNQGSGSILFGGVDTSKFQSPLVTLDILPSAVADDIYEFVTTVTALGVKVNGQSSNIFHGGTNDVSAYTTHNTALAVLLDTGSSAWSVPASYYQPIARAFSYVDKYGSCDCKYRDSGDSITLTFGAELNITVSAEEFIIPLYNATTGQALPYDNQGALACAFMISSGQSTGRGFMTLGDAVLRSMYVVFDLDNGQVSLAQSNVNSTDTPNVVTVAAGTSGVAKAVSGVSTAPKQTASVAPEVAVTQSFSVSTAASTIGAATGIAAEPTDGRPATAQATSQSTQSSHGAAPTTSPPNFQWGGVLSLAWMGCMGILGAALLL